MPNNDYTEKLLGIKDLIITNVKKRPFQVLCKQKKLL